MNDLFIRKFPEYLHRVLKAEAAMQGVTLASLICQILQDWITAREKEGEKK